jgi:hypothetical protein
MVRTRHPVVRDRDIRRPIVDEEPRVEVLAKEALHARSSRLGQQVDAQIRGTDRVHFSHDQLPSRVEPGHRAGEPEAEEEAKQRKRGRLERAQALVRLGRVPPVVIADSVPELETRQHPRE